ncbi:hypothetical protein SAMN04487761_12042 [Lachnospiraceae bacterium C7]|nr:hypothetical protein SAMN04487761_12042 [Lachnospiraceae bacterium C7]
MFFAFFVGLFLVWLPCLLTFYPGGIFSDTTNTIAMAKGATPIDNHNPVLYTRVWQVLYAIGGALKFNEYQIFFSCTIFQTILMALAVSYFLYSLYRKGFSKFIILISTLYYGAFNLIHLYVASIWKDTPFSAVFFCFSVLLFNIFWDNNSEKKLMDAKVIIIYSVLAYLISFSRNNGIYAFFLFTFALLCYFIIKKDKKLFRYSLVISIVLVMAFSIIRGPVYNYLGYNSDDKVESYGIPIQQICYIIENDGNVSKSEKEVINNIMPFDEIHKSYCPLIVDKIKWNPAFDKNYLNDHNRLFLRTYLKIVVKNPVKAIKGMALANEGFWDISRQTYDAYVNNTMFGITEYKNFDLINEKLGVSLKELYSIKHLFSSALFAWIVLGTIVISYRRRKGGVFMPLIPAMGIWITMIIATPLAYSLRYVFPLVLMIPECIAIMIAPINSDRDVARNIL